MNSLLIAAAAGLSFGMVFGYRTARAIFFRVAGPYARSWLLIGFTVVGAIAFLVPASVFAFFIARNLLARLPGGPEQASVGLLVAIAAGIGLVVASGLVIAVFAGAASARFIENVRTWWS